MMTCEDCGNLLLEYLFQELDAEARRDVAEHLTTCPTCAMEYCRLQADLDELEPGASNTPSVRVFESLSAQVRKEFRPSWLRRLGRVLAHPVPAYGASIVAVALMALWLVLAPGVSPNGRGHSTQTIEYRPDSRQGELTGEAGMYKKGAGRLQNGETPSRDNVRLEDGAGRVRGVAGQGSNEGARHGEKLVREYYDASSIVAIDANTL